MTGPHGEALPLSYVLPLRRDDEDELGDLSDYLRWLAPRVDLVIVDGSPRASFDRHARAWATMGLRHVVPRGRTPNGKVAGVVTGVGMARHERVVVADDDVRYDDGTLRRMTELLDRADVVRPQNYFTPDPWHARWDTARSLLNRALGTDHPGTLGLWSPLLRGAGGYDGGVLFENLELIRTVRAHGGSELRARDLYVRRRPPTVRTFLDQRVRQAYDDLAQPARLTVELAVLPAVLVAVARGSHRSLAGGLALALALAEGGRRRDGGTAVFSPVTTLFTPAWLLERAVCVWLAVALRWSRGGVVYSGGRLRVAANPPRVLRARARAAARRPEPDVVHPR